MAAYPIKIGGGRSNSAQNDLKRLPPPIQDELLAVCRIELLPFPRPIDDDEGAIPEFWDIHHGRTTDGGWRWRRGITRENRRRLDRGQPVDRAVLDACEYLIIFRIVPVPKHRHEGHAEPPALTVWWVLHNSKLGPAIVRWTYNQPRLLGFRPQKRDQPAG